VRFIQELEYARPEKQYLRQWRKARMVRLLQATSNPTLLAKYSEEFRVPPITEEGFSIINVIEKYPEYEIPAKFEIANKLIRSIISKSEKVVVWTSFIHNIFMLKNILKDLKIFVVYGDVPKDSSEDIEFNREQQISDFKNNKEASILLANPAACAESISLHSVCRNAVYLDRTFNCGQYLQSLDRIHRLGLKKNEKVIYHLIEAVDTIDETIENRLNEKIDRMKSIFSDELPLGSFETEDYEFDQEQEEKIDFDATIKDLKKMLSKKAIK
jgi:SNF2 family DNA or RNA helicase